jgi:transcriptional regulator with XRE-family HTH domain
MQLRYENLEYPMQHVKLTEIAKMAISPDERAFFVQLGAQVAELRKAQGITQIQMAETLGVSQQTVNSYEVARRRIPVSALPVLAKLLTVSIDELLGETPLETSGKRGPVSKLQQQIDRVNQLPRSKQKFVIEMIDTVIQQQQATQG